MKHIRIEEARRTAGNSKVLVVGAGGIGCELIKSLVLSGFKDIELIDMDTIEISNLNRQFLFRRHHVGESKAKIARQAALEIAPKATIVAHHRNVKEADFDIDFFKRFNIILNGLDNLDARRHVNRMALASNVPLVESGTTGYRGQVTVHIKGQTECFECQPKPTPKKFPVCTIRNTPDKPIHCIVWAKDLLFPRLFGDSDTGDDGGEANGEQKDIEIGAKLSTESTEEFASRVLIEVYDRAIANLLEVEDMWKEREPPKVLDKKLIKDGLCRIQKLTSIDEGKTASSILGLSNTHDKWSIEDNIAVIILSVRLFHEQFSSRLGNLEFDKDFDHAVDFVTSASNLRSFCYGIPIQNKFDAKGMAGNIIHAVATTNAIVAGLIVLEAQKILLKQSAKCLTTFVQHNPTSGRILQRIPPDPPNPKCYVCSRATLVLKVDVNKTLMSQFIDDVLCKHLAFRHPTVMIDSDILYEVGDDLEEDEIANYQMQRKKVLSSLPGKGIAHNSLVSVEDYSQSMNVEILVNHHEFEEDSAEYFIVEGKVDLKKEDTPEPESDDDSDDLCEIMEEAPQEEESKKRKLETNSNGVTEQKRVK